MPINRINRILWVCSLCFALGVAIAASQARAAEFPEWISTDAKVAKFIESRIAIIRNAIKATMRDQGYPVPDIFNVVKLTVSPTSKIGGWSQKSGGHRAIYISSGVVLSVWLYTKYATIYNNVSSLQGRCKNYPSYLAKEINSRDGSSVSESYNGILDPIEFCGVENNRVIDQFQKIHAEMFNDTIDGALGIIYAHELAHHLLGHLDRRITIEQSPDVEGDADIFGSKLLGPYVNRAEAAIVFELLALARTRDPFVKGRAYDPAECRFIFMIKEDNKFIYQSADGNILARVMHRKDLIEGTRSSARVAIDKTEQFYATKCAALR